MIHAGMAPSASAARAPIASISIYVGHNIKEGSVDLFRNRCFRACRLKENGVFSALVKNAIGMSIRHDETTMKVCTGMNIVKDICGNVRCLKLHFENGDEREFAPVLSHLASKTALNLFSGLHVDELQIPKLCAEKGDWEFIFLTQDSASPNVSASKYFVSELRVFETLLIDVAPCFAHLVRNATKHSLGIILPFGEITRMAHIISTASFDVITAATASKFHSAKTSEHRLQPSKCEEIWNKFLRAIVGQRGPFQREDRTGSFDDLLQSAVRIFPRDPPRPTEDWIIRDGATLEEVTGFTTRVFRGIAQSLSLQDGIPWGYFAFTLQDCIRLDYYFQCLGRLIYVLCLGKTMWMVS